MLNVALFYESMGFAFTIRGLNFYEIMGRTDYCIPIEDGDSDNGLCAFCSLHP